MRHQQTVTSLMGYLLACQALYDREGNQINQKQHLSITTPPTSGPIYGGLTTIYYGTIKATLSPATASTPSQGGVYSSAIVLQNGGAVNIVYLRQWKEPQTSKAEEGTPKKKEVNSQDSKPPKQKILLQRSQKRSYILTTPKIDIFTLVTRQFKKRRHKQGKEYIPAILKKVKIDTTSYILT